MMLRLSHSGGRWFAATLLSLCLAGARPSILANAQESSAANLQVRAGADSPLTQIAQNEPAGQEPSAPNEHEASAEHAESEAGEGHGEEHSAREEIFHWFNFAVMVGALVWLVRKYLVPFLNERGSAIREDLDRSSRAMAEANGRMSAIEGRMAKLNDEIAALRQAGAQEATAERARMEEAANADTAKILAAAEQEMAAAVEDSAPGPEGIRGGIGR